MLMNCAVKILIVKGYGDGFILATIDSHPLSPNQTHSQTMHEIGLVNSHCRNGLQCTV